ncbi:unnamed protein product [Choristocarpus tenellus]
MFDSDRGKYFRVERSSLEHPKSSDMALGVMDDRLSHNSQEEVKSCTDHNFNTGGPARPAPTHSLHSYVMNRQMGVRGRSMLSSERDFRWGTRTTPSPVHSAATKAVVCSARFTVKSMPLSRFEVGMKASAIDQDASAGIIGVGFSHGLVGILSESNNENVHFLSRDGNGCMGQRTLRWNKCLGGVGQVSDVKFRSKGRGWAMSMAWLGDSAETGSVMAVFGGDNNRVPGEGDDQETGLRQVKSKVRHGSVWCTEWDPVHPDRLCVGTSSKVPVSFFHVERETLVPLFKAPSDLFSMAFVPSSAPGAGNVFLYGLRNGSVFLHDPRAPSRAEAATKQNYTSSIASESQSIPPLNLTRRLDLRLSSGHPPHNSQGNRHRGLGTKPWKCLTCLPSCVNHLHILQDGRRFLAKDGSGGLRVFDLRWSGGSGGWFTKGQLCPVVVLVAPDHGGRQLVDNGRFWVDPEEAVVATPIPGSLYPGRTQQVKNCPCQHRSDANNFNSHEDRWGIEEGQGALVWGNGSREEGGDSVNRVCTSLGGARIRMLSVSSGERLAEVKTPCRFKEMSLSRTVVRDTCGNAGLGDSVSGGRGLAEPGFWGISATPWVEASGGLFAARLWPEM